MNWLLGNMRSMLERLAPNGLPSCLSLMQGTLRGTNGVSWNGKSWTRRDSTLMAVIDLNVDGYLERSFPSPYVKVSVLKAPCCVHSRRD